MVARTDGDKGDLIELFLKEHVGYNAKKAHLGLQKLARPRAGSLDEKLHWAAQKQEALDVFGKDGVI